MLSLVSWTLFVVLAGLFALIVFDEIAVLIGSILFDAPELPESNLVNKGRFMIVIAAHNESAVIERLLRSLNKLVYPRDRFEVFVVADNCEDNTAELARALRANVIERSNTSLIGKGHAIEFLFDQIEPIRDSFDATIFLDADVVVEPDYLGEMNRVFQAGYAVVQGNPMSVGQSEAVAGLNNFGLRCLAIYQRARFAMGFASRLSGNTLLVSREAWTNFEWKCTRHLNVEEEIDAWLIQDGVQIGFAEGAITREDAPNDVSDFAGQRSRWFESYRNTIWFYGWPVLFSAIRNWDIWRLEAFVSKLLATSHTVELIYAGLLVLVGLLTGSWIAISIACVLAVLKLGQICALCWMTGVPLTKLASLGVRLPVYLFAWAFAILKSCFSFEPWYHSVHQGETAASSDNPIEKSL